MRRIRPRGLGWESYCDECGETCDEDTSHQTHEGTWLCTKEVRGCFERYQERIAILEKLVTLERRIAALEATITPQQENPK